CAAIAALSIGGLPTDQFHFSGFLPAKSAARRLRLGELSVQTATLVFYESTHRIVSMLNDVQEVLGEREVSVARELTKKFETVLNGTIAEVLDAVTSDSNQQKGEFVVLIAGAPDVDRSGLSEEHLRMLMLLAKELPPKKASSIVAQLSGISKRFLYDLLLENKE
ncbi:MAG: 16S rRNA (cytidine(1402)-2'-O)-methyltransferase, partial [Pseudomonadales bacterium]|nr:16S rRNA (cytidine(1402)-2'-O)-methyltransferase [Pseudomonadales bacterium]